jgi:peptide-methionine (S)-S-oxide reductase
MAEATFAAGCFWGVEETFRTTEGVTATAVGYTGGATEDPSYEEVCSGATGHAEAVRVEYDPQRVSYDELLQVFWQAHDPTQLNRQGWDSGTQYRTAIFAHDADQKAAALASRKAQNNDVFAGKIVTEINDLKAFFMAEDYHQQYVEKRRRGGFMRG